MACFYYEKTSKIQKLLELIRYKEDKTFQCYLKVGLLRQGLRIFILVGMFHLLSSVDISYLYQSILYVWASGFCSL